MPNRPALTERHHRRTEALVYTGLWLIAIVIYLLDHISNKSQYNGPLLCAHSLQSIARTMFPLLTLFAVNNFILIPRLLKKNRLPAYLVAVSISIAAVCVWQATDFHLHVERLPRPPHPHPYPNARPLLPLPMMLDFTYTVLVAGMNLAVSLLFQHFDDILERERLMKTNAETRLRYLKAQINPHFYMNMLNNIHGMIEIDADKAQTMVIDMSRLMQYTLYESSRTEISLSEEIGFLRNYLHLMRQRYPGDKVHISAEFPSEAESAGIQVPPLLFLVFIENAFKHGISYREYSFVDINVHSEGKSLRFSCSNSNHSRVSEDNVRNGIGLDNVRQRLSLIFGDKADLRIDEQKKIYTINLTIPVYDSAHTNNRR